MAPVYRLSGKSLVPRIQDPTLPGKEFELTQGKPGGASLRTNRFRYTQWPDSDAPPMLYDLRNDPNEFSNLGGKQEWREVQQELQHTLERIMAETESP